MHTVQRSLCSLLVLLFTTSPAHAALDTEFQSKIGATLTSRVKAQYPAARVEVNLQAHKHTASIKKECGAAEFEVSGQQLTGRIPIRIRCHLPSPWSFFLQAEVQAYVTVVASVTPLQRGDRLLTQSLTLIEAPLRRNAVYYTDLAALKGQLANRHISANTPIQSRHLKKAWTVERGDVVLIEARVGNAKISTTGIAMQPGHVGEQIKVKNKTSNKVISPWVVARGVVRTRATRT